MVKIDYDYKYNSLYIYKEKERAKFSVNVLENFIIDIGSSNKVVGLEILNASKVLNVKKSELKDIRKAKLATLIRANMYGGDVL